MWEDFLYTTIPVDSTSDEVSVETFSEALKVLVNPYIKKREKVLLLMTIQNLFLQQGNLCSDHELLS